MEQLRTVPFGGTNLEVTNIGVGAAPLGGMSYNGIHVSEEQALTTLTRLFEAPQGPKFIDTASLYEESERRIGKAIKRVEGLPKDFIIATKADRDPQTGDFSATQIRRSVNKSSELLGMNTLPIVYLHDPEFASSEFPFERIISESVGELQKLQEEGLIKHIGISGGTIDMMRRYVATGAFDAVITHNRYTLMNRLAEPLITDASNQGLAVVNAAVYNGGILAKGAEDFPQYAYQAITPEVRTKIDQLEEICADFAVPLPAVALQFSLRNPHITSTIVGISSPEEINQTLEFAKIEIPEGLWIEVKKVPASTRLT